MAELERHRLPFSSEKQSEEQAVTSPPQLNPMMNPVLGRNLGRWAEVYFTTPVEQREQAVTELLHELERGEQDHPDLIGCRIAQGFGRFNRAYRRRSRYRTE